jgi:hypothetical protein
MESNETAYHTIRHTRDILPLRLGGFVKLFETSGMKGDVPAENRAHAEDGHRSHEIRKK